jgi:hypothetical protein
MTDVIAEPCTGVKDKACAGECPVDCIYEASGCSTPTPASASTVVPASPCARPGRSSAKTTCPGQWAQFTGENAKFSGQLGSPGGAAKTGPLPDDADHVASYVTSR